MQIASERTERQIGARTIINGVVAIGVTYWGLGEFGTMNNLFLGIVAITCGVAALATAWAVRATLRIVTLECVPCARRVDVMREKS